MHFCASQQDQLCLLATNIICIFRHRQMLCAKSPLWPCQITHNLLYKTAKMFVGFTSLTINYEHKCKMELPPFTLWDSLHHQVNDYGVATEISAMCKDCRAYVDREYARGMVIYIKVMIIISRKHWCTVVFSCTVVGFQHIYGGLVTVR